MTTIVVDQRGAKLAHQNGALMIRVPDERPRSVPLRLLDRLVIAAAVHIDSPLLTHLAEHDISLLVMPGRGHRRSALLHGHAHGDAARRLGQYQLALDESQALHWARRFVLLRMLGSQRLLRRALTTRPDQRTALVHAMDSIANAANHARSCSELDRLRGMEGAAAARFFAGYTRLFAATLTFTSRNRRPPRDPVNAALSLGYTLMHGDAVRALAQAGLDPMIGFLHQPEHNRESLACDLVEMARPRVEQLVWRLFADQQLTADHFTVDGGAARMGKAARQTFFAAFEYNARLHRRWFRRYAQALARVCVATGHAPRADVAAPPC